MTTFSSNSRIVSSRDTVGIVQRAIVIGLSIAVIVVSLSEMVSSFAYIPERPGDVNAYWDAAIRIRSDQPLYVASDDVLAPEVYRYAPWFAWLWIPLTYLPKDFVETGWRCAMVFATLVALVPLLMRRSFAWTALASILGLATVETALAGNVQPLLIAGLVWGVERRSGPVWIAVAASLKFVPLLYVIVYLGRREWRNGALAIALTAALVAPMLLFDLSGYATQPGDSASLYSLSPTLWAAAAAGAIGISAIASAVHARFTWLAASVAVLVTYPQAHQSYASHLLVGTHQPQKQGERQ